MISHTLLFSFLLFLLLIYIKHEAQVGSSSFKQSKPNADNEGAMEHDDEGEDVLDDNQEEERAEDKAEGEEGEVCTKGTDPTNEGADREQELAQSFIFYVYKVDLNIELN